MGTTAEQAEQEQHEGRSGDQPRPETRQFLLDIL
jgi:hypothetical protein